MYGRPFRISILVCLLLGPSAFAQNNRSAVSLNGSDANACTTVQPCRSFGVALAQTNPGGEIIALDTAGYGAFTIDRAVTVSGAPGAHAALSATSGNGIAVNAGAGDRVVLRNLFLFGNGGASGIDVSSAAETRIIGCMVRGFSFAGINISGGGNLSVDGCVLLDNGTYGVNVGNITAVTAHATISDSLIQGHGLGVVAEQYTAVVVVGSRLNGNVTAAEATSTNGGGSVAADMTLERCTVANNTTNGVYATASGGSNVARVAISQNVFAFNNVAVNTSGAGTVSSFQNNRFVRNTADGTFGTVSFQ
jgi:hypothetical protein